MCTAVRVSRVKVLPLKFDRVDVRKVRVNETNEQESPVRESDKSASSSFLESTRFQDHDVKIRNICVL
jgi:hypothetical protein